MPSLEQKRKHQKRIRPMSVFISIALVFVVIASFRGLFDIYQKYVESRKSFIQTEREWQALKSREIELTENLDRLSTPRGVEEEIREKFSVAKDGEMMALIVEPKTRAEEPVTGGNPIMQWLEQIMLRLAP